MKNYGLFALIGLLGAGCEGHSHGGEEEAITTVRVKFAPAGGAAIEGGVADPDGDGGNAPTVTPITLTANTNYNLTVTFLNELETPAEDITVEITDESDQHQVFWLGTAVNGPASDVANAPLTHMYSDMDANGLPIGLANTVMTKAGSGTLNVVLRHMPPVSGNAVKTATAASTVRTSGIANVGGSTDVSVEIPVTVN